MASGSAVDDEDLSEVRLLFDEYEPKITRVFTYSPHIQVSVVCAEQSQPGALQSGVFLWPAADALCKFLVLEYSRSYSHVIELGAGCGLAGLIAANILQHQRKTASVTFTDRDWTSLKMIRRSVKANGGFDGVKIERKILLWSETDSPDSSLNIGVEFDTAIGSDLVYSTESARSLLATVSRVMPAHGTWVFLLSSSFRDPVTTSIMDEKCGELKIKRTVLRADYQGCLLEEFSRI